MKLETIHNTRDTNIKKYVINKVILGLAEYRHSNMSVRDKKILSDVFIPKADTAGYLINFIPYDITHLKTNYIEILTPHGMAHIASQKDINPVFTLMNNKYNGSRLTLSDILPKYYDSIISTMIDKESSMRVEKMIKTKKSLVHSEKLTDSEISTILKRYVYITDEGNGDYSFYDKKTKQLVYLSHEHHNHTMVDGRGKVVAVYGTNSINESTLFKQRVKDHLLEVANTGQTSLTGYAGSTLLGGIPGAAIYGLYKHSKRTDVLDKVERKSGAKARLKLEKLYDKSGVKGTFRDKDSRQKDIDVISKMNKKAGIHKD